MAISRVEAWDLRFRLPASAGSDARHAAPVYSLAVCLITTDDGVGGTGITLTLGEGNQLVASAIDLLADSLLGRDVENVVANLGAWWTELADHHQLRWLGPHKGVVHLALASICGAIVDAWSHQRGQPLWRLLVEAEPDELLAMMDLTTIRDEVSIEQARQLLSRRPAADEIEAFVRDGHPAYDTSVGWLGYETSRLVDEALGAVEAGFGAVKIKVGSPDLATDVARIAAVREAIGATPLVMVDANQRYAVDEAIVAGREFARLGTFWFEEPVHPDDVFGYLDVAEAIYPLQVAGGEHLPNQVSFKTFLRAGALGVAQPDIVRLGGLPEFLAVALMSTARGVPVAPHVGDMGQIHQHLVPFLRLRLGAEPLPLEMIPHLRAFFVEPAEVVDGRYLAPTTPGSSTTLEPDAFAHGRRVAVQGVGT